MAASITCINCQVGDCDRCLVGHTQEGVLGGWTCPCKHDPDEAEARAERVREDAARMFFPSAVNQPDAKQVGEWVEALRHVNAPDDMVERARERHDSATDQAPNADSTRRNHPA